MKQNSIYVRIEKSKPTKPVRIRTYVHMLYMYQLRTYVVHVLRTGRYSDAKYMTACATTYVRTMYVCSAMVCTYVRTYTVPPNTYTIVPVHVSDYVSTYVRRGLRNTANYMYVHVRRLLPSFFLLGAL